MTLRNRLLMLERVLGRMDAFRVIFVSDGTDKEAERERYLDETGYRGAVVVMDETDRAL